MVLAHTTKKLNYIPEKNFSSKKNRSACKEKSLRVPFCVSGNRRFLSPGIDIIPPTRIQAGHFPACNNRFPRIEPLYCRDFLVSPFVLPI